MNLKKPKFWDYKEPNILAYLLTPIASFLQIRKFFSKKSKKKFQIKTICIGNIYIGGTGKTSLSIKLNKIYNQKNIKSCFIKKFYKNQIDEQKILEKNGKLYLSSDRSTAIKKAENDNYDIAILDDGLQDYSIKCDVNIICFNNINWIGNGKTIPAGPLREKINTIKKYDHIFLNGNLENLDHLKKEIFKISPKILIHLGKYKPTNINEFNINDQYLVFSGIGNHKTFLSMINNYGLKILEDLEYPDHYAYKNSDIDKIIKRAKDLNCKIITTEKDYLRLNNINKNQIKYLKSELEIIDEEKFIKAIS